MYNLNIGNDEVEDVEKACLSGQMIVKARKTSINV